MRPVRSFTLAAACVAAFCITTGCASKYGVQRTQVSYYPACYRPIAQLRESEHSTTKGTAIGALIGAVVGAGGGLLASDSSHRGTGAAVGAVVGAVSGGMAGNIYARKQQTEDENKRMAEYLQDLEGDIRGLDIVSASARNALQCYDGHFEKLTRDIRAKRVSRGQAAQMYDEIRNGREEAINILGVAENNGRRMDEEYRAALAAEERALTRPTQNPPARVQQRNTAGTPRQKSPSKARKNQARDGIAKANTKRQELNRKVEDIRKEREVAQARNQADSRKVAQLLDETDA